MRKLLIENGNNSVTTTTKATTVAGYIRSAKRIWPWAGLSRVKIRVFDFDEYDAGREPIIFETRIDLRDWLLNQNGEVVIEE